MIHILKYYSPFWKVYFTYNFGYCFCSICFRFFKDSQPYLKAGGGFKKPRSECYTEAVVPGILQSRGVLGVWLPSAPQAQRGSGHRERPVWKCCEGLLHYILTLPMTAFHLLANCNLSFPPSSIYAREDGEWRNSICLVLL